MECSEKATELSADMTSGYLRAWRESKSEWRTYLYLATRWSEQESSTFASLTEGSNSDMDFSKDKFKSASTIATQKTRFFADFYSEELLQS